MQTPPAAPGQGGCFSFLRLELSWIDLRVDPESVEDRFFDGLAGDGPADAERKLHAVDVAEIRVVDAVLDWRGRRRRWSAGSATSRIRRRPLPHQHHRQMRLLLDDEP